MHMMSCKYLAGLVYSVCDFLNFLRWCLDGLYGWWGLACTFCTLLAFFSSSFFKKCISFIVLFFSLITCGGSGFEFCHLTLSSN